MSVCSRKRSSTRAFFAIVLIYGKMADFTMLAQQERPAPPPTEKGLSGHLHLPRWRK